jgi:hypothetical protein
MLLACVTATGDSMTLTVISAHPIRNSLYANGLCPGENSMIRHRTPRYLNELMFSESISNIFISYVEYIKVSPEFANQDSVFLLDSVGSDNSDRALRVLGYNRILAALVASHMTNIFQILNITLFDAIRTVNR